MNRIFLVLAVLCVGSAVFVTAYHSTDKLQREASALHEAGIVQTQALSHAQSEVAELTERMRELKETGGSNRKSEWPLVGDGNQSNRRSPAGPARTFARGTGFQLELSETFIVVSKETLRPINMHTIHEGKLSLQSPR